ARVEQVEVVDFLGDGSQLSKARAVQIVVRRAADSIPRHQIEVGIEVLVHGVEMHCSRGEVLVESKEPTIDLGSSEFHRGIDVDESAWRQDAIGRHTAEGFWKGGTSHGYSGGLRMLSLVVCSTG